MVVVARMMSAVVAPAPLVVNWVVDAVIPTYRIVPLFLCCALAISPWSPAVPVHTGSLILLLTGTSIQFSNKGH